MQDLKTISNFKTGQLVAMTRDASSSNTTRTLEFIRHDLLEIEIAKTPKKLVST